MKKEFLEKLKTVYTKDEFPIVEEGLSQEKRPVTFRVNTLKADPQEIEMALEVKDIAFTKIPYIAGAYMLEAGVQERVLWDLAIYKTGKIYLQSLASQLPTHFLSKENTPKYILDATAAPGGKTSQLSEKYPDAEIFAFEKSTVRAEKLQHNMKKLGCKNVMVIRDDIRNIAKHFEGEVPFFDIILVDAPCSSEGRFDLNNEKTFSHYDTMTNKKFYSIQKKILGAVLPYLSEGGELLYSTCTLSPEENENVVHFLLSNFSELQIKDIFSNFSEETDSEESVYLKRGLAEFGKQRYKKDSQKCLRILPSEIFEGFFIASFVKETV